MAVRTVRGWRNCEKLVEEKPQSAFMAARFRNPSIRKDVRGLSPKA
jgi:hypothetical protein